MKITVPKTFLLAFLAAMLAAVCVQSYFNHECMTVHADAARVTVAGVMCVSQDVFRTYYSLDDLKRKHNEKIPDPRYIPPPPTAGPSL
jgi:hypothetical protein